MINPAVLAKFKSDPDSFRRLFTADPSSELGSLRKDWEERIQGRIHEGMLNGIKNYKFYAAADLAWDSNIITKELVPLQMYAQGRIDFKSLGTHLKDIPKEDLAKFCDFDDKGQIKDVRLSKFHEVFVNLVRSFITRRTASLALKYTKLYPFMKYEPLSTSWVAKLRGDVLSQRIEMVTNAYGYRHDCAQAIRDMLLYGHTIEFAMGAWDVEKQIFPRERADGFGSNEVGSMDDLEARVVREGLLYARPHPTRTFTDESQPKASINTDTGCSFMGYWNVVPFRTVEKNPVYFNRDKVAFNHSFFTTLGAFRGFWELYYPGAAINFMGREGGWDPAGANDRLNGSGFYTPERGDQSLSLVEYRERVIPKEVGLGDYPYPVWVRLVVAGDRTVIFGEFLPSTPATYWGYNEDDNRRLNNAWAHDIMPWGDQLSNMLSQLFLTQKAGLIKIIAANIDLLSEEQLNKFRSIVTGNDYFTGPILFEFKGSMLRDMDLEAEDVVKLNEANMLQDVTVFFRSIIQLLSLAERVLGVSSNESGQSEPREVSATESANIANTVNTTLAFMGLGVDEALDAKKKMLYEAFIAHGSDEIYIPVVNRYTQKTIQAAGFKPEQDEADPDTNYSEPKSQTLTGSKRALVYDYNFSSRDGSERMSNSKAAEVLVNLLGQLLQIPGVLQDMGKDKLYEFLNAVVRLSGAGVDLTFDVQEGEPDKVMHGEAALDGKEAIQEALKRIMDAIQQDRQKIAELSQMVSQMAGVPAPAAAPAAPAAMPAAA